MPSNDTKGTKRTNQPQRRSGATSPARATTRAASTRRRKPDLWRTDFSALDARTLRLAQLALAIQSIGRSHAGLARHFAKNDELLQLLLPLIDPTALQQWATEQEERLKPETLAAIELLNVDDSLLAVHTFQDIMDSSDTDRMVQHLLRSGVDRLRKRLRAIDDGQPLSASTRLLVDALQLDDTEARILDFVDHYIASETLRVMLRTRSRDSARVQRARLAEVLSLDPVQVTQALKAAAPLRAFGLLNYEEHADMEDFIRPSGLLRQLLDVEVQTVDELLGLLIEAAPKAEWSQADFPHLQEAASHLSESLARALSTRTPGINALLHGPPGTGKTEFARAIAADQGLRVFQVRSGDEDGDGLNRRGRLSAYLLAQRLLSRRRDAILIFDEIEDVFESEFEGLAFFRPRQVGRQKGWINRILEDNQVPAIWITNNTSGMDPAFLRRFVLPLAFRTPPLSVRRQMVDRHLGEIGLSPQLLDDLAADDQLTPAQFGVARKLADLRVGTDPNQVARTTISAQRTLLRGSAGPRRREPATDFNAAFLNLDGEFTPAMILRALERLGRGSLCFYGPPGTGKTQFAEVLADALDRELIARQASDLISPYVGETEQNLAVLFNGADPAQSIILLDEVDSFLANRADAKRQWERTQVNELLQQMERFPGIFIAATNLMSGIDAAALRRFDFKLHFQALKPEQRVALFAREVHGDAQAEVTALISRNLAALDSLTVGDFANVCRQRALLDADWTPEQFLRRLVVECRLKQAAPLQAT